MPTAHSHPNSRRLRFRGWTLDVHADHIELPPQTISSTMSTDDLASCLQTARTMLHHHRPPSPTPPTRDPYEALTAVLQAARHLAASHWHPRKFDIYHVTQQAWIESGMIVAHAALLHALRTVIPAGTRLLEINDRSTRDQIAALYTAAIDALPAQQGAA